MSYCKSEVPERDRRLLAATNVDKYYSIISFKDTILRIILYCTAYYVLYYSIFAVSQFKVTSYTFGWSLFLSSLRPRV